MPREVALTMPKMSMTMESGELLEWTKSVGDRVMAGEVVASVATDKVDMDVESPVDGTLIRTVADPGAVVGVGQPLGFLETESEGLMDGLLDVFDSAAAGTGGDVESIGPALSALRPREPSRWRVSTPW